jgi:hypothetical protein
MDIAVAMVLLVSCTFTLNPDKSGKVVFEVTQSPQEGRMGVAGGKDLTSPEAMGNFAREIMRQSRDIEVWSDITVGTNAAGLLTFKGTAYFKDISRLRNANDPVHHSFDLVEDPKGGMILTLRAGPRQPPSAPAAPKLADEQLTKIAEEARTRWKQERPQAAEAMTGTRFNFLFRLPGKVEETNGLKKAADGSVSAEMDMAKVFDGLDKLMQGDVAAVKALLKVGDPMLAAMENVAGTKSPWTARITGQMKPQFDYAAEVKAANEAYPKMAERLRLPAEADAPK